MKNGEMPAISGRVMCQAAAIVRPCLSQPKAPPIVPMTTPIRDATPILRGRALDVVEVYEQPKAVETAAAKARDHILPVGSTCQIVEKQVDPNQDHHIKDAECRERDNHAGGHAGEQPSASPSRSERGDNPDKEHRSVEPQERGRTSSPNGRSQVNTRFSKPKTKPTMSPRSNGLSTSRRLNICFLRFDMPEPCAINGASTKAVE